MENNENKNVQESVAQNNEKKAVKKSGWKTVAAAVVATAAVVYVASNKEAREAVCKTAGKVASSAGNAIKRLFSKKEEVQTPSETTEETCDEQVTVEEEVQVEQTQKQQRWDNPRGNNNGSWKGQRNNYNKFNN